MHAAMKKIVHNAIGDLRANGDRTLSKSIIVCYRGEAQWLFHDGD
jgi:hypothetical protein